MTNRIRPHFYVYHAFARFFDLNGGSKGQYFKAERNTKAEEASVIREIEGIVRSQAQPGSEVSVTVHAVYYIQHGHLYGVVKHPSLTGVTNSDEDS